MALTLQIVLCAASLFLAWLMVWAEHRGKHLLTYLSKTLASLCFVMAGFVAAWQSHGTEEMVLLLLGGLTLGMLGDIFLCRTHIAEKKYWLPLMNAGGAFFLLGHLCYFAAFLLLGGAPHPWLYIVLPLVLMGVVLCMKLVRHFTLPSNWVCYLGYAAVSGLMLSAGIEVMLMNPVPSRDILAAAAVTFIFSDVTLAVWSFSNTKHVGMRILCITAYYAAQILFVFGIQLS